MESKRRDFLKITGLAVVGLGVEPTMEAFALGAKPRGASPTWDALEGARWAMVIDAKKCPENCKDCIIACHRVHNVPDIDNSNHEIKWIWRDGYRHVFPEQQNERVPASLKRSPLPLLCNQCDNPPCVRVCPTKATFRRDDGIVMMDYHRCIGCRFCMAACPYGSRSFNYIDPRRGLKETNPDFPTRMKGVVEKCNFCAERLAKGQIPACVEACKEKALIFGDLNDPESAVSKALRDRFAIRRRPELGTQPQVYYIM